MTFFPGEEINGFLYIKGKESLENPLLLYSLVNATLTQIYYYEYDLESKIETEEGEEKLIIFVQQLIMIVFLLPRNI